MVLESSRCNQVWPKLVNKVYSLGPVKTFKQFKVKIRNLKDAYKKCKDENEQSGNERRSCAFYEEFDQVLSVRNVVKLHQVCEVGMAEELADHVDESLLNYVSLCPRALRAYVPTCLTCLRAYVPLPAYLPTCLRALNYYVPTCLRALNYYVPTCLRALNFHVLTCLYILFVPTCLHALNYFMPTCAHFARAYVPATPHKIY